MTLIVTVVSPGWVFQVSDRRISLRGRDGRLARRDDLTNKAVILDGRVSLAAAGKAELATQRADIWIATQLAKGPTLDDAFAGLRDALTELFKRPRYRGLELTVVGAGWSRSSDESLSGFYTVITNRMDAAGWHETPLNEFWYALEAAPPNAFGLFAAPDWFSPEEVAALRAAVKAELEDGGSLEAGIAVVVSAVREAADRHPGIGKDLMLSVLPEACGTPRDEWMVVTGGGISDELPTFFYLPAGGETLIHYGPTVAGLHGGVMTDFTASPITDP